MAGITFDASAIRALADILVETGLTEIEISEADSRIRVVRAHAPVAQQMAAPVLAAPVLATPSAVPPATAPAADLARHPGAVLSPMVGIAYLSPDPSSPPFVTIGQAVSAGQTVMLIEAMKTFNQIKAPTAGRIVRILVQPGSPVEFAEPLMLIEP
jgi:acetyl-CoA carboxylase biotin carboxyl carrier protein